MFDPTSYFDRLNRAVEPCKEWADSDGPEQKIISDNYGKWSWCTWRFEVTFPCGHHLAVLESHTLRKGVHLRKIKYRLTKSTGEMVVQVDPHGSPIPYSDTPHIHIGPDQSNRVYEGDPLLKEYSLRDYDFLKMWELVETYIETGALPWAD